MGDIAVTLVDLAQRDLLRVEEAGDGADWLLSPLHGVPARRAVAGYEARLLGQLAGRGQVVRLSSLAADLGQGLGQVRRALEHEVVAQGWVRRLRHGQRTPKGEELARHVRSFQRELRKFKSDAGEAAVGGMLLPYALRFGFLSGGQPPLARFARDWVRTFGDLPGWRPAQPARPAYDTYGPVFPEADAPPGWLGRALTRSRLTHKRRAAGKQMLFSWLRLAGDTGSQPPAPAPQAPGRHRERQSEGARQDLQPRFSPRAPPSAHAERDNLGS